MANWKLRNYRGAAIQEMARQGVARGLYMGASHVLTTSNNIAPKDEGPLIQTSGVAVDVENGVATEYYTQKYAPKMHENPQYNFQGGRQGKFLEKAVMSESEALERIFGDALRGEFGG